MKSEIRNLLRLFSYHIICAYFVVSVSFAGQVEGGGGSIRCGGCGAKIGFCGTRLFFKSGAAGGRSRVRFWGGRVL